MSDIVERFEIDGRIALVRGGWDDYHCGYIQVFHEVNYDIFNNKGDLTEEATFGGPIEPLGFFIGFDSNHWCDNQMTKSREAVKKRLIEFAKNIIKHDKELE
jgi:hypothetical protein